MYYYKFENVNSPLISNTFDSQITVIITVPHKNLEWTIINKSHM